MRFRFALVLLLLGTLAAPASPPQATKRPANSIATRRITYHGWPGSILLSNGQVEAVVVPNIGRVMQFRFAGEEDGPLWENRLLDGKKPDPDSREWINFGGDKSWPAPQADWKRMTDREWPPPATFDAMPVKARLGRGEVELVSSVSRAYGIRVRRRIRLDADGAGMRITTIYEKVRGAPVRVSVWVITQLDEPERVFVPRDSRNPQGYRPLTEAPPRDLTVGPNRLSLTRDPARGTKIGTDGEHLVWMDHRYVLAVMTDRRQPQADYPDQGSSVEVWTNPDPLPYIELETLGPLREMKVGDTLEQTNYYLLSRRSEKDPETEAGRFSWGLPPAD
ncbi:MAG TPA: hypothetical protein VLE48_09100 [Terriglobales bacterium]|nr:hypothetical protein [Terriglobales bacterium]